MPCLVNFSKCPYCTNIFYSIDIDAFRTFILLPTSITFTMLLPATCLGREFEFTFGESSKVTHPILINCNTLFLKAMQASMLWPTLLAWYSQVNSGLYQIRKSSCIYGSGGGAICLILSNFTYNSFRVVGKDASYSSYCWLSLLW